MTSLTPKEYKPLTKEEQKKMLGSKYKWGINDLKKAKEKDNNVKK